MKQALIGRQSQIEYLQKYIASDRSEFIAIYGRRRIGKTFLVKELFEGEFYFRVTGRDNVTTAEQLANFKYALSDQLGLDVQPQNWMEAFRYLQSAVENDAKKGAKIIFIDELPWFDTLRSDFISAFEHFWNDWASYRNDIKLIVCGSATTWMLDKVINSRGGLHNRVTHKMLLSPFSLKEVEQYFAANGFNYDRSEIIESYMCVGGVAYYLSLFENDKSVAQNIQSLCFTKGGELTDEFDKVFKSLFKKSENHIDIITCLKNKGKGMTRLEIIADCGIKNNGRLSTILEELEQCDFIRSYVPFGKQKKDKLYQLIDPFTLFYFRFMGKSGQYLDNYWLKMQSTPAYTTWCGYAFEIVCLHHVNEIVRALGIDGCINVPCSWSFKPSAQMLDSEDEDLKKGTQIDLLIDRSDKSISICEMKYGTSEYEITKSYNEHLNQRLRIFKKVTKTKKSLIPTYITPHGLLQNAYSRKIARQVTGDDLFN